MPRYERWIWWVCWALVSLIRPFFCRFKVEGRDNLPMTSGAIVACNHNYGPDYVFLGIASPRELRFMAKSEAFTWSPVLTAILRAGGVFPVKRGTGDTLALGTAIELAQEGNLIAMFPEGTRSKSGKLMRGKTGAARIALAAGVPVVPVAVINSAQAFRREGWRRPLVRVRFGKPIFWQAQASNDVNDNDNDNDGEAARAFTDAFMLEIANLLPQELRGEYEESVLPEQVRQLGAEG